MPDTHPIFTYLSRDRGYHKGWFKVPLTLFDRVLGLNLVNRSINVALLQKLNVPYLDSVVLTPSHQNVMLGWVPVKIHGTLKMSLEFTDGHVLLSHIPNTYKAIPLTRGYLPRVMWIEFDAFNLSSIELQNTLLIIDWKYLHSSIIGSTHELPWVLWIPIQKSLGCCMLIIDLNYLWCVSIIYLNKHVTCVEHNMVTCILVPLDVDSGMVHLLLLVSVVFQNDYLKVLLLILEKLVLNFHYL